MVSSVMHGDEHLTCAVWFKKKKKFKKNSGTQQNLECKINSDMCALLDPFRVD